MMKPTKFLLVFAVTYVILSAGFGQGSALAGNGYGWSLDERVPGYLDDTFTPFLLADRNRTVHAFASQRVENDGQRLAIVYRQWTLMGGWTRPVDIILSPVGGDANIAGVFLDSSDTMHVIFTATVALTRSTSVYYSSAPAASADWVPAWSAPIPVGEAALGLNSAAIAGDEQGNLIIIYSGNHDGSGVYFVHSKDSGKIWSEPLPVFLTNDSSLSTFSLRLIVSPTQNIRAAWNVVTNLGVDEALYFANFDSTTSTWDTPVELDRRIDLPDYFGPSYPVIVDNGNEIVVFYNGGNPFTGRPVGAGRPIQRSRISVNGGITWNEPLDPFPFHVGRSGEHTLVLDGNGTPHTLFIQRIESLDKDGKYSIIGGIWHSSFQNGGWTNPDRLITTLPPSNVRAVVSQGNVFLAVWIEDQGVGKNGVWYSYTKLDVPELPVVPISTLIPTESASPVETVSPVVVFPTPSLSPFTANEQVIYDPASPLVMGIVPVTLLLVVFLIFYVSKNNLRGK